jgi:hypothetical protein
MAREVHRNQGYCDEAVWADLAFYAARWLLTGRYEDAILSLIYLPYGAL